MQRDFEIRSTHVIAGERLDVKVKWQRGCLNHTPGPRYTYLRPCPRVYVNPGIDPAPLRSAEVE